MTACKSPPNGFLLTSVFTPSSRQALKKLRQSSQKVPIGFKLFMAEQVGGLNIDDDQALLEAFSQAAKLGVPVAVHAEDHALIKASVENLKLRNRHNIAAFLKAHDETVRTHSSRTHYQRSG